MYSLDTVFRDIRTIISSVVIKYENVGKKEDNLELIKAYDIYNLAVTNSDTFLIYDKFDERAIRLAGITEDDFVKECVDNKNKIPMNKRELVVYYQRFYTIDEYCEKNNYYRTLNGQPELGTTDFIYIDIGIASELEIDPHTPIHKLTDDEIMRLEHVGELAKIQKKYNKKYLFHLGANRVPISIARDAKNFTILQMSKNLTENFYIEFNKIYSQCRDYYMSVLYIKEYSKRYEKYDNFIAMMIMLMAIQRMFVNTFKYGIDRDFYDLGSIKLLFDSYHVPFIEDLPISYQRLLMKNLNNLLKYKSSDKVLFDICSILGFDNIHIYKYYLSKEHIKKDNKPIFMYKNVIDEETGEDKIVYDWEKMFNIKWKSVDLKERNVPMAMLENSNISDYYSVIDEDPFWIDDADLRKRMYESEFNYIESKYLKMNIMYNMTEVLFETIYAFRMLADKKDETQNFTIKLPRIFDDKNISVFDTVILLSALLCKRNGFKGNIISTASKTLSILGFNFDADFTAIRSFIKENDRFVDQKILQFLNNLSLNTASDINKLYSDINGMYKFISDGMRYANRIEVYRAYKTLYDALMITQDSGKIFEMSNGEIAETYTDFLKDRDADIYAFLISIDKEEISDIIEHILIRLKDTVIDLQHSHYISTGNNVLLNALIKLIQFFKSYTTDLTEFNILYVFDNKILNSIKLISQMVYMDKFMRYPNIEYQKVMDKVKGLLTETSREDYQIMRTHLVSSGTEQHHIDNLFKLSERYSLDVSNEEKDVLFNPYNDFFNKLESEVTKKDKLNMRETIKIIYET